MHKETEEGWKGRNKKWKYDSCTQYSYREHEEMKNNHIKVKEELYKTVEYADTEVTKLENSINDHTPLSDLKSNLKNFENSINTKKNDLNNKNESIKDKVNQIKDQSRVDMSEVSESYINTINDCTQFINQSWQNLTQIDNICDIMKKNKLPKYDESKLKKKLEKRDKAFKELEEARADYMKLWRLVSEIKKDEHLLKSYNVSLYTQNRF